MKNKPVKYCGDAALSISIVKSGLLNCGGTSTSDAERSGYPSAVAKN